MISRAQAQFIDVAAVYQDAATKYAAFNSAHNNVNNNYPQNSSSTHTAWNLGDDGDWRAGFTPGVMWEIYGYTNDSTWKTRAEKWTAGMADDLTDNSSHDVGFQTMTSYGQGYALLSLSSVPADQTLAATYKQNILTAANTLSTRFNTTVGSIRSWGSINATGTFEVIIDNMMNLQLELAGGQMGGASAIPGYTLTQIATTHATTTMNNHVRADGSTYHVLNYNQTTGQLIGPVSGQGNNSDLAHSTWSRGQSWAINGFTMVYRYTQDQNFLNTAIKTANFYIDNLPVNLGTGLKDYVPPADFTSTFTDINHKDSSAAAIAADGLLELSTYVTDPTLKAKFQNTAVATLQELTSSTYLSTSTTDRAGMLLHSAQQYSSAGEDTTFTYGDYYLLEALNRYNAMGLPEPASITCIAGLMFVLSSRRRRMN